MKTVVLFLINIGIGLSFVVFDTHSKESSLLTKQNRWLLVDNFEQANPLINWVKMDTDNNTQPYFSDPQVTEVRKEPHANNHSFGLSNLSAKQIEQQNYNAFEPMLRVTDKFESNGYKNDGTLMVMGDNKRYHKIQHLKTGQAARPLVENSWYELWYVINNATLKEQGQSYDLYIRGGEFEQQQKVFEAAQFRMKREQPLAFFMIISNTGPAKKPYGNGGLMYDDIYKSQGVNLSEPVLSTR